MNQIDPEIEREMRLLEAMQRAKTRRAREDRRRQDRRACRLIAWWTVIAAIVAVYLTIKFLS